MSKSTKKSCWDFDKDCVKPIKIDKFDENLIKLFKCYFMGNFKRFKIFKVQIFKKTKINVLFLYNYNKTIYFMVLYYLKLTFYKKIFKPFNISYEGSNTEK